MPPDIASRDYYFELISPSITIRHVCTDPQEPRTHQHDLTTTNHLHDFKELVIVIKGSGTHCLEGNEFEVAAGDVFLIHEKQKHFFQSTSRLEIINIMYIQENLDLPENELRKIPGYSAMFILEPNYRKQHRFKSRLTLNRQQLLKLLRIVHQMENEDNQRNPGFTVMLLSHFLELLTYLSRAYSNTGTTEARSLLRLGKIIGMLESDYTYNWSVDELSAESNLSKSSLMRLFKKATGQTPIEYLTHIRMQEATRLLNGTDLSIMEIAIRVGYSDSNYFTRCFRKVQGVTPSSLR